MIAPNPSSATAKMATKSRSHASPEGWKDRLLPGCRAVFVFLDGKALPVQVLATSRYTVVATTGTRLLVIFKHALKCVAVEGREAQRVGFADGRSGGVES